VSLVVACMNWAVGEQRIAKNPLKGIRRKKTKRRERIIPPEHMRLILDKGPRNVVRFLFVLSMTGMRPFSELARLTAAMIDWEGGTVTFEKHKNAKKGKRRVVFFTPEALGLLKAQAEKHPEGFLFRTRFGNAWSRNSCRNELARACEELGIPKYGSYDFRRTYITQGLAKGLTANVMAQLCGNTPEVINRYYDSLHLKQDTLREAARRVLE
jgi:integrase